MVSEHPHGSINNSYIVVLKEGLPAQMKQNHFNFLHRAHQSNPLLGDGSGPVSQVYDGHINGYAGRFSEGVVEQLRALPEVAYIEKDQIVRTQELQRTAPWVSNSSTCRSCELVDSWQFSPGFGADKPSS